MSKISSMLLSKRAVTMGVAMLLVSVSVVAQGRSPDYAFLVGSGFLCQYDDPSACPAVARSLDGATYELSGVGTLNAQKKSVKAAGTFTHRSANGTILETGIWTARQLLSFETYGNAPGALRQAEQSLGLSQFGPPAMRMLAGPTPAGGLAVLRIRLLPLSGLPRIATLQVNCALGKVPDQHPNEGIRLTFAGKASPFDEEVSGRTMFLVTIPERRPAPNNRQVAPGQAKR